MKYSIHALIFGFLAISSPLMGQQTIESTFGKGVTVVAADESFSMKFNARVQSLCSPHGFQCGRNACEMKFTT